MQSVAPPHVTIVYPEETVDVGLLLERVARETRGMSAFPIRLGVFVSENDGRGGVFVSVEDCEGGLETLRDRLLLPPQRFSGYPFHVTIAHPRTSSSLVECWEHLRGGSLDVSFVVREVLWTLTDDSGRKVLERFPLAGQKASSRTAMAGGVVVEHDRVLLCLRHPNRESFPDVWDVPGGHVEPGESPRQTLHRELREELGVDAMIEEPWHRLVDDDMGIDLSLWRIRQWRGEVCNLAPHEHQRLQWFTAADLHSLELAHPTYTSVLNDALKI